MANHKVITKEDAAKLDERIKKDGLSGKVSLGDMVRNSTYKKKKPNIGKPKPPGRPSD